MLYPLNVDLSGRSLILVGGGRVAERKACSILSAGTEASICVIAPKVTSVLQEHAAAGRLCWKQTCYADGMLEGAFLAYAATNLREVNAAVASEAKRRGIPVNVIDDPAASTFQVPASIRRGELMLSVSTAGGSPALSRAITGGDVSARLRSVAGACIIPAGGTTGECLIEQCTHALLAYGTAP